MNSSNLVGRLTRDPEMAKTAAGIACARFTVAVKRPHTADKTDFLPCVAWRQAAEYLCQYARKGYLVSVSGYLTAETSDNGETRKTYYNIVCDEVSILTSKGKTETQQTQQTAPWAPPPGNEQFPAGHSYKTIDIDTGFGNGDGLDISSDDLPF